MAKEINKEGCCDEEKATETTAVLSSGASQKTRSFKQKFFSLIIRAIFSLSLAVVGAVALYWAIPFGFTQLYPQPHLSTELLRQLPIRRPVQQPIQKIQTEEPLDIEEVEIFTEGDTESFINEETMPQKIELPPEADMTTEPTMAPSTIEPVAMLKPEPSPLKSAPVSMLPPLSVLNAIRLHQAFIEGGECRPLLEELIKLPNKTVQMNDALMNVLPFCLDRPLPEQMQSAFNKAKKRAILRIFENENAIYVAYLKTIPYLLADIRQKNPTSETPIGLLNQIQNAVEENQAQQVLTLLAKLPDNVQLALSDVKQYALREVALEQALENLMQLLFKGGEND